MSEEKDKKENIYSNIESDLYSVILTILNLDEKYKKGTLKNNFLQKTMKNSMNELLKINFLLNKHNIILSKLLKKMRFTEPYYKAIDIINNISELRFPEKLSGKESGKADLDPYSKSIRSSILEIPGVTAQITSSFITLMDAIKLNTFDNKNLITKLFGELGENLHKFPGLELIRVKFDKLFKSVEKDYSKFIKNKKFRDSTLDDLYKLYQDFQDKLNLKD